MVKKKYDLLCVLSGGITNSGDLTELSRQRLDKAVELFLAGAAAPCGDLLDREIERRSLILTREFFRNLPADDMPDFKNHDDWYKKHRGFYKKLKKLQNPTGKPGLQAYWGVRCK